MSVKIVNKELYENRNEDEIWLHRYFSSKYLNDTFQNQCFKINFRRVDDFGDGLEGWNHAIPNIKKAVKIMANYNNRVIDSGGTIVSNIRYILSLVKDKSQISDEELILGNIKERELSFASCWFATESKEDESRIMWNLYSGIKKKKHKENEDEGGNVVTGVKISVKWSELKASLGLLNEDFEVGFVDYSESKNIEEVMFKKDSSYSFEKEFRILIKTSNNKERIISKIINPFSSPKVYCKVWDSYDNNEAIEKVLELGFEKSENAKRQFDVSKLIPEFLKNNG